MIRAIYLRHTTGEGTLGQRGQALWLLWRLPTPFRACQTAPAVAVWGAQHPGEVWEEGCATGVPWGSVQPGREGDHERVSPGAQVQSHRAQLPGPRRPIRYVFFCPVRFFFPSDFLSYGLHESLSAYRMAS